MSLIVQKFGGSSVKDAERIKNVAGIIADTYRAGNDVIVVLSVDDQIDPVGKVSIQHLLQVGSSHGAAGFQIGAAEVEHDGHFVLTAA